MKKCSLPLTGLACVHTIVTELAMIEVTPRGLVLKELARQNHLHAPHGRLAIGVLTMRRGRVRRLDVDEFHVGRLHIRELIVYRDLSTR